MSESINKAIQAELDQIKKDGLFKEERIIVTPQSSKIGTDKNVSTRLQRGTRNMKKNY